MPLQPIASPTDQFIRSDATPDLRDANRLAQVAGALSEFDKTLTGIAQNQFQAHQQNSTLRAEADRTELALKNRDQLNAAVRSGKIREADNPWYMRQLKEGVARSEAVESLQGLSAAYEELPNRSKLTPSQVKDWAGQKLAGLADGRDVIELAAMSPILEQGTNRLLSAHVEFASREREIEMEQSFHTRLGQVLEQDGDKSAAINGLINEYGKNGVSFSKLNAWARGTILTQAAVDDDVAGAVQSLLSVKTPGGTLADTAETKLAIREISREIENRRIRAEAQSRAAREDETDAAVDELFQSIIQANPENPGIEIYRQIKAGKIPPALHAKLVSKVSATAAATEQFKGYEKNQAEESDKQAVIGVMSRAAANISEYLKDPNKEINLADFISDLSKINSPQAFAGVENLLQSTNGAMNNARLNRPDASPVPYSEILTALSEGNVSQTDLVQAYDSKRISDSQFLDLTDKLIRQRAEARKPSTTKESSTRDLTYINQSIIRAFDPEANDLGDLKENSQTAIDAIKGAQDDYDRILRDYVAKNPKASEEEIAQMREKATKYVVNRVQSAQQAVKAAPVVTPEQTNELNQKAEALGLPELGKLTENSTNLLRARDTAGEAMNLIRSAYGRVSGERAIKAVQSGAENDRATQTWIDRVDGDASRSSFFRLSHYTKGQSPSVFSRILVNPLPREWDPEKFYDNRWNATIQAQYFEDRLTKMRPQYDAILTQFGTTKKAAPESAEFVKEYMRLSVMAASIRSVANYNTNELKLAMKDNPESWRFIPVFSSEAELRARGPKVIKELGIEVKHIADFTQTQMNLLQDRE